MKTILLMVHDDPGQEARLQCALDVTRAVDGHMVCLDLLRMPVIMDAYGVGLGQAAVVMDEREREDAHIARLEKRLGNEGVSYEWARMQGEFDVAIADSARLADLIVVSCQGTEKLKDQGDLPGRLAQLTSTPILVVPPNQDRFDLFGKALVGWDGSAPAAAAIRGAAPLLGQAAEVEVLTIGDDDRNVDPQDVARYLARHGAKVETDIIPRQGNPGDQLLKQFAVRGAAWGVIGAYGHSRAREQIFGGTTRTMLTNSPIPLLISH